MKNKIVTILFSLLLVSCQSRKEKTIEIFTEESVDTTVVLRPDYPESTDTLRLSNIADSVFYVKLQYRQFDDILNVQYFDSLIFVQDYTAVFAFNPSGELLYKVLLSSRGCLDVDAGNSKFYTYTIKNQIKAYDFKGNELEHFRARVDENSFYGFYFLAINDSLFARAEYNAGYNEYELDFINKKGRMIGGIKNVEPHARTMNSYSHHESWPRPLFRCSEGLRYHRCYGDTLFAIQSDMTLRPVLIEQKISKVPLDKRLESVGGDEIEYRQYCLDHKLYATRIFENNHFFIVDYLMGKSWREFANCNYLVYDKKNGKLNRIENDFYAEYDTHKLHLGIFNDYDGGLAFAPFCQSGDYLIMVNAGDVQMGGKDYPKRLYEKGRKMNGEHFVFRSNVYRTSDDKQRADRFFQNLDEEKETALMIVKLKRL